MPEVIVTTMALPVGIAVPRNIVSAVINPSIHYLGDAPPSDGGPPNNGYITGVCLENGIPLGGCTVYLYYKPSGELIRTTESDGAGNFQFFSLNSSLTDYYAVAIHDTGITSYNLLSYSNIQPDAI
jgi:hypothetical protein